MTTINVQAISTKEVTTRFGNKQTYSVKSSDGTWYKHGFKKPTFKEGDTVEIEFKDTSYGPEITSSKIVSGGGASPISAPAARPAPASGGYSKPFPIPPLHGDRAIIRQNSLTNAREAWVAKHGGKVFEMSADAAMEIVHIARVFEAYSCGDMDMEMAKEMAASSGVDVDDII